MTRTSKTVVFFGNERLATAVSTSAPTLRALIDAGYKVAAVVSHNSETASRKQRALEVAEVAAEHGIPLLLPEKPAAIIDQLRELKADIGVLAAYGKLVPKSVIDIFPGGIINVHPSLLPKHRGPIPIESVILQGERQTGVSVMGLVKAMDAGPIYAQKSLRLTGSESKQQLVDSLATLGSDMILEVLADISDGTAAPATQDEAQATYDELITKEESVLDFTKPAARLEREVRAYLGWPGSRTTVGDKAVVITVAHIAEGSGKPGTIWREGKQFGFHTSGGILVIDSLKPAGKGEMSAEAFLAGYAID